MPDVITAAEYLEIASTPLATPAWRITSLVPLWVSADLRGSDRLLPGASGVRAQRRRLTVTRKAFELVIFGRQDRTGNFYDDVREGLDANIAALQAAIVDPPGTATGTRAATWHRANGSTATADVHVLGIVPRELSPAAVRATLQLSIPTGRFT